MHLYIYIFKIRVMLVIDPILQKIYKHVQFAREQKLSLPIAQFLNFS